MRSFASLSTFLLASAWALSAFAQVPTPPTETGLPPADAAAIVKAPTADKAPEIKKPVDGTTVSLAAGAQAATGNSQLFAFNANGAFDHRRGINGFGAALVTNYAEGAPEGQPVQRTTQNIQGRLRYDLYYLRNASGFLILTGRNDYFEGIDFRLNVDPGVKYLFLAAETNQLWAELGYDYQYQINSNAARVLLDTNGMPVPLTDVEPFYVINKDVSDHSVRLFAGYKHAFNKEVTLSTGLEYLQSVVASTRYRINYNALVAAKLFGGFSIGFGFVARYDHDPLPGKVDLDTSTTLTLIYSFSTIPTTPPPCPCPVCPAVPPPPPPPPVPAPAPTPAAPLPPAPATIPMLPPAPPAPAQEPTPPPGR